MNKKIIPKIISISLLIVACIACIFFARNQEQAQKYEAYYLNTIVSFTFYNNRDASLAAECFALCDRYEKLLSRTVEGSDIWNINHAKGEWVFVDAETYALLQAACSHCANTDGLLDCTVAPLMDLWNFTDTATNKMPPTDEELSDRLVHVDYRYLEFKDGSVRLSDPDSAIDLGFIAKGYIGDRIKEFLVSEGVTSAIINLGGNIITIGTKPDGSPYQISIRNPLQASGSPEVIPVTDRCVTTSGTYERYFIYEDVSYHHILDPSTGKPVDNGLISVTIISDDAATGDALSTACLLMGKEKGLAYIKSFENVNAVFIEKDGTISYGN